MSVVISLQCDGRPGADHRFGHCPNVGTAPYPWQNRTATRLRRALRGLWHRTSDGRDICPQCWKEGCYKPGAGISPSWCATCVSRFCSCDNDDYEMPSNGYYDDYETTEATP